MSAGSLVKSKLICSDAQQLDISIRSAEQQRALDRGHRERGEAGGAGGCVTVLDETFGEQRLPQCERVAGEGNRFGGELFLCRRGSGGILRQTPFDAGLRGRAATCSERQS